MEAALQALIAAGASFFFVAFILSSLLLLCRRYSNNYNNNNNFSQQESNYNNNKQKPSPSLPPQIAIADESFSFDPVSLPHISISELSAATKGFSPDAIVGDGAFGFVYRAHLSSGADVAVKRLSADAFHGLREFRAEMETLGRIKHQNLARLLGYCAAGPDRLLIYEFLDRGSLDLWLHPEPGEAERGPDRLSWSTRLKIVKDVAAGLKFLHDDCKPKIIHRDIKSSNVLLDSDFGARIADFGLARSMDSMRSHVSTQTAGTMGYMPPEYRDGWTAATAAADVYSFGALMIEVATGLRPSWPVRLPDGVETSLVRWARAMIDHDRTMEIVDRGLTTKGRLHEEEQEKEMKGFFAIAYRCTEDGARKRPSMAEVVMLLQDL